MKKPLIPVSDHAVIRYLERVQGVDVEAIRAEIGRVCQSGVEYPGASGVVVGGFRFKIKEGVVTTVLDASRPDVRTGRQRRDRPE